MDNQFTQILALPNALQILDELVVMKEWLQILSGQPLPPGEFLRFRALVVKTLRLFADKQAHVALIRRLLRRKKLGVWIANAAAFATNITAAVSPLVTLLCHSFNWPYAELWRLRDGPGASRRAVLVDFFTVGYRRWRYCEPVLQELGRYTKRSPVTLPSGEIPATVFSTWRTAWAIDCQACCSDARRVGLMQRVGISKASAFPIPTQQSVEHVLVFYGTEQPLLQRQGPQKFAAFSIAYVGKWFGTMEKMSDSESDADDGDEGARPRADEPSPKRAKILGAKYASKEACENAVVSPCTTHSSSLAKSRPSQENLSSDFVLK